MICTLLSRPRLTLVGKVSEAGLLQFLGIVVTNWTLPFQKALLHVAAVMAEVSHIAGLGVDFGALVGSHQAEVHLDEPLFNA